MEYRPEAVVQSILMIIICLLAVLGNGSLFILVFSNKKLQTISNYYVLSLAAADLMVTLISGPVTAVSMLNQEWMLGDTACTIFGFITLLTFVASVANLAMIALNRYFFIVQWQKYKSIFNNRRAILYGLGTWCFSIILSVPPLFGWSKISYIPEKFYCFVHWPSDVYYMYFMLIICFCGPLIVMSISYYKILSFTKTLKKKLYNPRNKLSQTRKVRKREARMVSPEETKLTNTLLIVVACFIICWAPFAITMFFDVYHPYPIPRVVHIGSLILGYLNSMCNPILYGVRSTAFRRGFINLYAKCLPCLQHNVTVTRLNTSIMDSDHEETSKCKLSDSSNNSKNFAANNEKIEELSARDRPHSSLFNSKVSPTMLLEVTDFVPEQSSAMTTTF